MRIQEKTSSMTKEPLAGATAGFNPELLRKKDFPIFERLVNGKRLIYLDNAATTQKPRSVIHAVRDYYHNYNANVHRGAHTLSEEATDALETSREKVAQFIGGVKPHEIIFTRNATEAINLVAHGWARQNVRSGERIVATEMEHHANLVPWIVLAKEIGAELKYIPITRDGRLDLSNVNEIISSNTKLVTVTQMSNVLGTINPVDQIIELAHRRGALALVDGAQSVPHMPVDIRALDADFLAFSAHKMLGPTGIGVLYGKESLLERMEPVIYGGEMISEVELDRASWNELPFKFEAGTPDIAGAIGFAPALDYLNRLGMETVRRHEMDLAVYALERLSRIDSLKIFGPADVTFRGAVVSFASRSIHPHDLATFLDTLGIAVRAGHHCAQPLTRLLGEIATTRASFYIYNTREDIDELAEALKSAGRYFGYARSAR
jgi:cysteine desulfurase/selenocysteine lyase